MQRNIRRSGALRPKRVAIAVSAAFLPWMSSQAWADPAANQLPTGANVAAGNASISVTGSKMQIDQSSDKAIINWQNFSIGSSGWVNFNQPSASSVALNRSMQPAEIFGRLSANGQVFITSQAGVYFARTAQVDVGGLVASNLSIRDQDFLAGRYIFFNDGSSGSVTNDGTIVTPGGYAALAGTQVRNDGVIVAQAGTVTLAAGDRITLDMIGDGLIKVSVDAAALNALALNAGTIQADGGRVVLTARGANALLDTVVNNTGIIRARSLVERNGEIVLDGGNAGVVVHSGTLDATSGQTGSTGGSVNVSGQYVVLSDGSTVNASGDAGGGTVTVKASDAAYVHGAIEARDTSGNGKGGTVETSAHYLEVTKAPNIGAGGTWLIDPFDIEVVDVVPPPAPGDETSRIAASMITGQLNDGTNVILDTGGLGSPGAQAGDISVLAAIDKTVANPASLTLKAFHDVSVNEPISIASSFGPTGFGTLNIDAGNNVLVAAPITTQGGGLNIRAGGFTNQSAINNGVGGDLKPGMAIFADRFDLASGTINGGLGSVGLFTRTNTNTLGVEAAGNTTLTNADIASITTAPDSPLTNANQLLIGVGTAGTMRIGDNAQVNGGSKNLIFTAGGGAGTRVTVGANGVTSTGDVAIDGTGGSIAATGTISGNHVVLRASTGIGTPTGRVSIAANTLAVNTGGNAYVSEADNVTLDNVVFAGASVSNSVGGTLDFAASGSVTVGGIVFAGSGMNVNVGQDLNVVGTPGRSAILTTNGQQTVSASNISLQAAASGTNGRAIIANTNGTADQTINVSGTLRVTGGDSGVTNTSAILTNGNQAINGNAEITLTGGASGTGSVAAQTQNSASIQSNGAGKTQTINAAKITLKAGGGNDTFAAISAANQFITVGGDVDIKGGSGTGVSIARIGGIGTPAGATNLNLSARDVIITGGDAVTGEAGLGGTVLGTGPQPSTINISASRDVTLNGGTGGARIGTPLNFATPAGGNISINAGRNIELKGGANTAAIRTAGNLTLHADQAGGTISETGNGQVQAASLTTTSNASTTLPGPNQVGSYSGTSTTGSVSLTNNIPLTVALMSAAGNASLNNSGNVAVTGAWNSNGAAITVTGGGLNVGNAVTSTGAMTVGVDGTLTLDGGGLRDARLDASGGQTISAQSLAMLGQNGRRALINNNVSGNQTLTVGTGGIDMNVIGGAGVAQISDNAANTSQSVSTTGALNVVGGSGSGSTNSGLFTGLNVQQTVNAGSITLRGATAGNSGGAFISNTNTTNTLGSADQAVNVTGGITIVGGESGLSNRAGIVTNGNQTISGNPDITLTGGASGAGTGAAGNSVFITTNGTGKQQTINAGTISVTAGTGGTDTSATITAAKQLITTTGDVLISGGGGGGDLNGARIGGLGGATPSNTDLTLHVGRDLVIGGGSANGASVGSTVAAAMPHTIDITAGRDVLLNASSGAPVRIGTSFNFAPATGNITVTAERNIQLNGSPTQSAAIRTTGNVSLSAAGSISENGANGHIIANELLANSFGNMTLTGDNRITSFSGTTTAGNLSLHNVQSLTVASLLTSAGTLDLDVDGTLTIAGSGIQDARVSSNGGQTINAQSLLVSAQDGRMVQLSNNGSGDQTITISAGGASAGVDVRTTGSGFASVENNVPTGTQTLTVVDGDHLAVNGAGALSLFGPSGAGIIAAGNQVISVTGAGANAIRVGSSGALGTSNLRSSASQTITAGAGSQSGSITVVGPATNSAFTGIVTNAGVGADTQTISTTGAIQITAGSAPAQGNNFGTGIFHNRQGLQTINAGSITLRGGTGGSNNVAFISTNPSAGPVGPGGRDQLINVAGNIDVIGSDAGVNNRAIIVANNGNQTINAGGDITIHGGASSISATTNAAIVTNTAGKLQTINSRNIEMSESGGTDSFAGIIGTNQVVNATGNVTLTAGTSGGTLAGVRIGGAGGAVPQSTNLTMDIGGDLLLTGGAANNGVGIGSSALSSQSNNITIRTGGSVILNEGSGSGARIGGAITDPGNGNIGITAGGNIELNGVTQRTAIRTNENVTLSAGGIISEAANGFVASRQLTTTSGGNTTLTGPNLLGAFSGSTFGGDLTLNNSGALNVTGATVLGNTTLTNAGDVNLSGSVTSNGTMNLDVAGALNVIASPTQDAIVTSNAGQTIHAHSLAVTAQNGHNALLTNSGAGNQSIDISGGGLGAGIDVQNLGGGIAVINSNAAGGTQTITVSGGDHVAVRGSGGFAGIGSNGGAQSISLTGAGANAIVVGSAGALGTSQISGRGQTVTAGTGTESGSITIIGSAANGTSANMGTQPGSGAVAHTISTSGDLTITGGSAIGAANSGLFHSGTGLQSVSAANIALQGGTSTGTSGGGAFISNTNGGGDQDIFASGSISVTAGGVGQGNRAFIVTNGNQTVHGDPGIVIRGGAGGGGSAALGTSNGAGIVASAAGTLQVVDAASITLAGGGGNDSFAVLTGNNQVITVSGDVQLTGGSGSGASIARIGGGGQPATATNLSLSARDVILTGGGSAGGDAGIGSTVVGSSALPGTININAARDMILTSGAGAARIGTSPVFTTTAGGDISVAAGRNIQVNGAATIRTSGNVALNAGGSISETGNGQVVAADLTTTSGGNTVLGGANQVSRFTAESESGDVSLRNTASVLTLDTMDLSGSLSIDQTGALAVPGTVTAFNQSIQATGNVTIGSASGNATAGLFAPGTITIGTPQSIILRGSDVASGASSVVSAGGLVTLNAGDLYVTGGAASQAAASVLSGELAATTAHNIELTSGSGWNANALLYSANNITMTVGGLLTLNGGHSVDNWVRVQTQRYDGTITLNFPNAASGSVSVDGFVDKFKHGEDGFFTADKPAKLGDTLFVNYGL